MPAGARLKGDTLKLETYHKEEKKEEITAGGSAAIGIGWEVSINLKEIYNFFYRFI